MDDPALLTDANAMTNSSPIKATLSTLPAEVLDRIFWLVDRSDLINLRLVCRLICDVANRPFATRHFADSHHVVTKHSLETLLAVSEHKVFGAYIKNIMISPARTVLEIDYIDYDSEETTVEDSFARSGKCRRLIQQIFVNVRKHIDSIALEVHEDCYVGRGRNTRFAANLPRKRCHGEGALLNDGHRLIAFRTSRTIKLVVAAMRVANISIDSIDIKLTRNSWDGAKPSSQKAILDFLQSRTTPLDLGVTMDYCTLKYKHKSTSLRLAGTCSPGRFKGLMDHDTQFLDNIVQWVWENRISELRLESVYVEHSLFTERYLTQSLKSVTLEDIKLNFHWCSEGLYSTVLKQLSEMPELEYCRLRRLHYSMEERFDGPTYLNLLSGQYSTAWTFLLLVFPNGEADLEIQGTDISRRLEDLAAYTAAAEKEKVLAIEAAQYVTDYRVVGAEVPITKDGKFESFGSACEWIGI